MAVKPICDAFFTIGAIILTIIQNICKIILRIPTWWRRDESNPENITFWEGSVYHRRTKPVKNEFTYPISMALVSLDNPPTWFNTKDYLTPREVFNLTPLATSTSPPPYTVSVLTNPKSCDYTINPISVYYVQVEDKVVACVAEVTNTPWGETVRFYFNPEGDAIPKCLHVSAFMDMEGKWECQTSLSQTTLSLLVIVNHPEYGRFFTASLTMKRIEDSPTAYSLLTREGWRRFLTYSLMPHRILTRIHWQATKLKIAGCPYYDPPTRYKQKVIEREQLLQSQKLSGKQISRTFNWREAPGWPWTLTASLSM